MHVRGKIVFIIVLTLVILTIGYGFLPKPVSVDTVKVRRGPMMVTVDEEGKTRVIDRFVISAPVAGFARRIKLDAGDAVSRGQALAQLEPRRSNILDPRSRAEAQARVAAAKAALKAAEENMRAARAGAEYAEKELERIRQLQNNGLVSQDRLDQADAEAKRTSAILRSSEFAVEVARFDVEAARTALQYSAAVNSRKHDELVIIRAPVKGRVLKIQQKSEGVVNEGQALIEIGDPRALEVEVDVLSADAVRIIPGTKVLFERWGGKAPLEGLVRIIEPAGFTKISALGVEEQRVLVISDIISEPESWEHLGDGYRVEARFILWKGEEILQIPSSSLFRRGDGWAVFTIETGRAQLRDVEVGHRNGLSAEVVSGLTEGTDVITYPDSSIEDTTRVKQR
jgi:HlyD family secretion protein